MAFKPPRTAFLDFPLGCPAGKPNEPEQQREILKTVLKEAFDYREPWKLIELPFQWSPDGNREWEETVRNMYRNSKATLIAHKADHGLKGSSLVGRETEFTIRCKC